ncbi:type II secretion system major pseudopilin GspG [Schlesneria paludicola]|uniref:type II secretion system major pseudopilin GspG n=1 Tax=Schlesneria paludicola TaxID=360056 RepID=UPI00029B2438|nr:type II secretion system major pseudopilin GspG [Schlesneria paludicola]
MKRQRTPQPQRRGFTLVEMLVVLAILVLLISMVGPRILGSKQKADISAAKTQMGMLFSALETYVVDMADYPDSDKGLNALLEDPSEDEEKKSKWGGPYIKKSQIPKDPWGNDYQYEYPGTHSDSKRKEPEIWSMGPDGQDGTDDDITSWEDDKKDGE